MKACKTVFSVIICILIAVSTSLTGFSSSEITPDRVKDAVEGVISYKCEACGASSTDGLLDSLGSQAGVYTSDWFIIALSLYGVDCRNSRAVSSLKNAVNDFYSGDLSSVKVTDMQRAALTLLACGENITSVNGHNLLADCTYNRAKYKSLDSQGVNSVAYALILLDSNDFSVPENAETTRDDMIKMILDKELDNGGFALFGSGADIDVTTIVLQALAPYRHKDGVAAAIDRGLSILSGRQGSDGAYKSFANKACAESTAQVALALTANGISPVTDGRFIKNGNSVMDGLMAFKLDNGAFCHFSGDGANSIATYQSLCALVGCYRFMNGTRTFYYFKSKGEEMTSELDKAIEENKTADKAHKTKSKNTSHSRAVKKAEKQKKSEQPTESTTSLKSTSGNSKITFMKVERKKKKVKKIKTDDSPEVKASATGDEASLKNGVKTIGATSQGKNGDPQYIPFAVIILGYPALAIFKIRRKK